MGGSRLCFGLCRSCINEWVLIVFGSVGGEIGVAEDAVLGVIVLDLKVEILAVHEILMFFWEVTFGHGSAFAFCIAVDTLFEPVGDEGAFAGGGFVVGVHLGGVVAEH